MQPISAYTDYRNLLRDLLASKKKENPKLSHRNILKKMGISSTGFLSNVLSGKKNLTHIQIRKLGRILNLNKADFKYFETLVYFNQAKKLEEKNEFFFQLLRLSRDNNFRISEEQFQYFTHWCYSAIRKLLTLSNFDEDFETLSRALIPSIRYQEVETAIDTMSRLGVIYQTKSGSYLEKNSLEPPHDPIMEQLLRTNFHASAISLTNTLINDYHTSRKMNLSSETYTLSDEGYQKVKKELDRCRKKIYSLAENDKNQNRVYQFNSQLFPLSFSQEK